MSIVLKTDEQLAPLRAAIHQDGAARYRGHEVKLAAPLNPGVDACAYQTCYGVFADLRAAVVTIDGSQAGRPLDEALVDLYEREGEDRT